MQALLQAQVQDLLGGGVNMMQEVEDQTDRDCGLTAPMKNLLRREVMRQHTVSGLQQTLGFQMSSFNFDQEWLRVLMAFRQTVRMHAGKRMGQIKCTTGTVLLFFTTVARFRKKKKKKLKGYLKLRKKKLK